MSYRLNKLKKFWKNKKIFLTGHTGFKGSWLLVIFNLLGAKVYGYSLKPSKLSLYNIAKLDKIIAKSSIGDIRDYSRLKKNIKACSPDFIIHMAAQPLVRESYDNPKYTYDVNTLGTLNILDIIKNLKNIKNSLIITTDKVYENASQKKYFKENDKLGGDDPYSNSKTCAEMICSTYNKCFFSKYKISCVTVRAGNVIGGGDFATNRIIPDYFRALDRGKKLYLRYPEAIRPWQHVLEPLYGYILLLMYTYKQKKISRAWNFGPNKHNNIKVKKIIDIINKNFSNKVTIKENKSSSFSYKESNALRLDSRKSKKTLKWYPKYNINITIKLIADWHKSYLNNQKDILNFTRKQIVDYLN